MKTLIEKLLCAARQYTLFDFAVFKLSLLSIGILLGVWLQEFFCHHLLVVVILAILCCGYVIYTTVNKGIGRNKGK